MRKHFLILMLMALLPLAGWAEGDPVDLPSDLAVTFTHAEKYTGAAIPVDINTATGTVGEDAGQNVKANVEIEGIFADQACTNEILPENLINAGTYYVWAKDAAGNVSPNSASITLNDTHISNNSTIWLTPGKYHLTASFDHLTTYERDIEIKDDQKTEYFR